MARKINIDREKCTGCGQCAAACHQGVVGLVDGKAALIRADYCDGLGNCLPACPSGAISFIEQEAAGAAPGEPAAARPAWPIQLKLAPPKAARFENAALLIAADCTAFAAAGAMRGELDTRVVLIGCPKLDGVDYSEKLTAILQNNRISSVLVARMEVPCCGGIVWAAKNALSAAGKDIPGRARTFSVDGNLLSEENL